MFNRITDSLNTAFRRLSGQGKITEANVREAMAEVRTSLLEADVHYDVVTAFCESVVADALGAEVTKSLRPGQEMIGIVHRRLVELLGGDPDEPEAAEPAGIMEVSPGPAVVMMCGLQGSGKTTTCGKLAAHLRRRGRTVMLCAADLQRPAAVEQLQTVAAQVAEAHGGPEKVRFFGRPELAAEYGKAVGVAVRVCEDALAAARRDRVDVLILDTAGRLHVNDELMGELERVERAVRPHHIFLVTDAMTGQDALASASAFNTRLPVDGLILTKFDSDTRGGAALSVRKVTGAPIRYIGTGEKLEAFELFHPARMAGRILGMGDVVGLVEKAQQQVSEEEAARLEAKMARGELDMTDFLKQLRMLRRMGPLKQLLGMLPGVGAALKDLEFDDSHLDRIEAQIGSMTVVERSRPDVIELGRRRRIAKGSGTDPQEVGNLVKTFGTMNRMSRQLAGMGGAGRAEAMRALQSPGAIDALAAGGIGGLRTRGSTRAESPGSFKKRKASKGGGGKKRKR